MNERVQYVTQHLITRARVNVNGLGFFFFFFALQPARKSNLPEVLEDPNHNAHLYLYRLAIYFGFPLFINRGLEKESETCVFSELL